jgi:hypothetical protein
VVEGKVMQINISNRPVLPLAITNQVLYLSLLVKSSIISFDKVHFSFPRPSTQDAKEMYTTRSVYLKSSSAVKNRELEEERITTALRST